MLEHTCKAQTIVGDDYDNIVIQIHDYYKEVFARAQTSVIHQTKNYDFSTNNDPFYWCNKLKNHTILQSECLKRGIPNNETTFKTKREIASLLI